jgi:hypothetical protein|tara:strand:- start:26 stop:385 length:360 start_codon:yes stop_codon:yes gene_type:complete
MATVKTNLKLQALGKLAGILSLNYAKEKDITVTDTAGDSVSITTGDTSLVATGYGATAYVFILNNHSTHQLKLKIDAGTQWGVVEPSEWAFFSVPNGTGLKVASSTGTIITEYVIMKKV